MQTALLTIVFFLFSLNAQSSNLGEAVSKEYFEKECIAELEARKQYSESNKFCSAYIVGFIDGANNPKGCEIKDLTYFIKRFISFSKKQRNEYFGNVVKSFVGNGCKAL